ncbi:MAG: host-nuclease inhibitor Gam family protein [Eubacteriales bacterium]|nr:host-nuclease inhibitor Gam family protein [Eubacteriales bacterium]
MARRKIDGTNLKDWNGVSESLAAIGSIDRQIETREIAMQQQIDAAKADAAKAVAPLLEEKARLETQIKLFVDAERDELGDKKSKTLYFGTVGYRKSTKIILPRIPEKLAEIVIRLRARSMDSCIISKPDAVNKDELRKYDEQTILDVGAKLEAKDAFWYEIDRDHLSEQP